MNPCRPFAADLDLLVAGVLPPGEERAVEAHVAGCADCRERYERTRALCAGLSAAGQATEPPDAAAWRLRSRVRTAVTAAATGPRGRWRVATATATAALALACATLFIHRNPPSSLPPHPATGSSAEAVAFDPPLTLLACERAVARSDAALDQLLSSDAARPCNSPGHESLRAFSPASFAALDQNSRPP